MAKVIALKPIGKPTEETGEEIKKYEELVKQFPRREENYNRLMIIYRKQKAYKKELAIIEKGIKVFNEITKAKPAANKNIIALSKKINMLAGLVDKKGNALHRHQPVAKWEKRKEGLLKKLMNPGKAKNKKGK